MPSPGFWLAPRVDHTLNNKQLRARLKEAQAPSAGSKEVLIARLEMAVRVPVNRDKAARTSAKMRALVEGAKSQTCVLPGMCGVETVRRLVVAIEGDDDDVYAEYCDMTVRDGVELLELATALDVHRAVRYAVDELQLPVLEKKLGGACFRLLNAIAPYAQRSPSQGVSQLLSDTVGHILSDACGDAEGKARLSAVRDLLGRPCTLALCAHAFAALLAELPHDVLRERLFGQGVVECDRLEPSVAREHGDEFGAGEDKHGRPCRWQAVVLCEGEPSHPHAHVGVEFLSPDAPPHCVIGARATVDSRAYTLEWQGQGIFCCPKDEEAPTSIFWIGSFPVQHKPSPVTLDALVTVEVPTSRLQLNALVNWAARHTRLSFVKPGAAFTDASTLTYAALCELMRAVEGLCAHGLECAPFDGVLFQYASRWLGHLRSSDEFELLPAATMLRLVAHPAVRAGDVATTLQALAPWLERRGSGPEVGAVLRALPLERARGAQLSQLLAKGGALHALRQHGDVRELVRGLLAARVRPVLHGGTVAAAQPPDELLCPITHELLCDAVLLHADGQTYSQAPLLQWLSSTDTPRSPLTNEPVGTEHTPNWAVRKLVDKWREQLAEQDEPSAEQHSPPEPRDASAELREAHALLAAAVPAWLEGGEEETRSDEEATPPQRQPAVSERCAGTPAPPSTSVPLPLYAARMIQWAVKKSPELKPTIQDLLHRKDMKLDDKIASIKALCCDD